MDKKAFTILIILFFLCLCCPMSVLGYTTYRFASQDDTTEVEDQQNNDRYVPEFKPDERFT